VTAGVFVGWFAPWIAGSDTRVRTRAVWEFLVFVLNGLAFILIGLQLETILSGHVERPFAELLPITAIIALSVILVRLGWVFLAALFIYAIRRVWKSPNPPPSWRETFIVGWSGLRGAIALASALALPLSTPGRNELLFITFGVILVTLVGQGLTLPLVTRVLALTPNEAVEREEEVRARAIAVQAALARLEELASEWPGHLPLIDTLRMQYEHRGTHLAEPDDGGARPNGSARDAAAEQELLEHGLIRRAVLEAERNAVLRLRTSGALNDEAWRRVERDLDLEELRMEA
jgi:CPA1 family monovalent cation:H+ antiporter